MKQLCALTPSVFLMASIKKVASYGGRTYRTPRKLGEFMNGK